MATIRRVATWKEHKSQLAVEVELSDGRSFSYAHVNIKNKTTAAQVQQVVLAWVAQNNVELPQFHIHINRDRSLAFAIGGEPDLWPEDE